MSKEICHATVCTYPGGGCWGVRIKNFELGDFDRVQLLPNEVLSQDELAERLVPAGTQGLEFVRRLRTIPCIGSYTMLNRHGFAFSMEKHRERSGKELAQFTKRVLKEFCEVYGFKEMQIS